jgi:deoxynucleoside triphosphate triphosphohydrolase SAMHD1
MPKAKPGIKFSHEAASEDMLSALVDENDVDISPSELNFIKDLIHGEPV